MAVLGELSIRFLLGGAIVSAFAAVGEGWKPKTFGGVFGAAPSVALASLALAYHEKGAGYVRSEALPMLIGAVAFHVYCALCVAGTRRKAMPVWLAATVAWLGWFGVALSIYALSPMKALE